MFIQNKYFNIYFKLVEKAKQKIYNGYTERHHIVPISLNGSNDKENLIRLSAREHFIAHRLLVKITKGMSKRKMINAVWGMMNRRNKDIKRHVPNSRTYNLIRTEVSKANKIFRKEQVRRQGTTMSKEARIKLSKAAKGRTLSDLHKKRISQSHLGKKKSKTHRENLGKAGLGRTHSDKTKQLLSRLASKSPKPLITCNHCGKIGGVPTMKRWHLENCNTQ